MPFFLKSPHIIDFQFYLFNHRIYFVLISITGEGINVNNVSGSNGPNGVNPMGSQGNLRPCNSPPRNNNDVPPRKNNPNSYMRGPNNPYRMMPSYVPGVGNVSIFLFYYY